MVRDHSDLTLSIFLALHRPTGARLRHIHDRHTHGADLGADPIAHGVPLTAPPEAEAAHLPEVDLDDDLTPAVGPEVDLCPAPDPAVGPTAALRLAVDPGADHAAALGGGREVISGDETAGADPLQTAVTLHATRPTPIDIGKLVTLHVEIDTEPGQDHIRPNRNPLVLFKEI